MKLATYWQTLVIAGLGWAATGTAVQGSAVPPGVYYAWQTLTIDTAQCLELARQALASEGLDPVQADDTSVGSRSETVTAVFVCAENPTAVTTVMVVVASDDDTQAINLLDALKLAF